MLFPLVFLWIKIEEIIKHKEIINFSSKYG